MAMSGMRRITTAMSLLESTPPRRVVRKTVPHVLRRLPERQHPALEEVVHWSYGAGAGLVFGALPDRVRRLPWAGPAYGLLLWGVFQVGVVPLLHLELRRTDWSEQWALIADHLLYGLVVAGFPAAKRECPVETASTGSGLPG